MVRSSRALSGFARGAADSGCLQDAGVHTNGPPCRVADAVARAICLCDSDKIGFQRADIDVVTGVGQLVFKVNTFLNELEFFDRIYVVQLVDYCCQAFSDGFGCAFAPTLWFVVAQCFEIVTHRLAFGAASCKRGFVFVGHWPLGPSLCHWVIIGIDSGFIYLCDHSLVADCVTVRARHSSYGDDRMTDQLPFLDPARAALRDHVLRFSVKRGDFTLKSGAKSSWFLDTKQTACRPDGLLLVADVALSLIPKSATAIGGLTMGADPVAFAIAAVGATRGRQLRSFSVRKEAKDHGVTGRVAGALQPGDRVVITEDTVTRGTSILEAVEVVRAFGAEPILITVIVDRGGTCAEMARAAGVDYLPMLTAPDLGFAFGS